MNRPQRIVVLAALLLVVGAFFGVLFGATATVVWALALASLGVFYSAHLL